MTIAPLTLKSATTQANAPFCAGHAFKQGDVPSGSQLTASVADFQVTPKNAWPDGSLKFAVLAGRAAMTGGVDLSVALTIGTPVAGTALALADLKATGITASLACGAFGTVSWATTDWDAPFEAWTSGPKMSSWIYRKSVGADAHLVGWLEVRLWSGGEVEVLPWIENGYRNVAAPANKSATYVFTLGGTQRESVVIDLKHHQRTPVITGAKLAHWLGTDPAVTPLHDSAYLQASELVPSYRAVVAAGGGRISTLPATYTPLQQASFNYDGDSMASSGYQTPIGLLPEHDVLHLVAASSDRVTTYNGVIRNGYGAGRYGLHYRDETTQRPLAFSTYPTLVFADGSGLKDAGASTNGSYTPTPAGGSPASWDTAHSPSVGYLAYLLTGRFYFKELVQFAAITNHFNVTDWVRGGGASGSPAAGYSGASGICVGAVQTRSAAWWFRSVAQALAVTPDAGDPLRAQFIACVEANCAYFHAMYVAQANNPFGMIEGAEGTYGDIAGKFTVPVWQQDFVTMAWGQALSLNLPISSTASTKMAAFFAWKAKSVILRLGTSSAWWYINAAPYTMPIGPSTSADYRGGTGPWLADAKASYDMYAAAHSVDAAMSSTEGVLGQDYPASAQPSMWHNLQPAIAYAVRHGVTGAQAAYDRMVSASNWSAIQTVFNTKPVWSVMPAATSGASAMPTPGPTMRVGQLLTGKMAIAGFRGRGITPAQVATGFAKPSLLEQHIVGADPASEFLWVADTVPGGLTFNINENSSFAASAADGVYNGTKTVRTNGAESAGTYQFAFGEPASEITGVTISPTTATGSTTFTKTVSGTGSFSSAGTFSKISGGGSINASTGAFVEPAKTGSVQTIVVRFTSTQDPNKWAEATITIAAGTPTVTGVTVSPSTAALSAGDTFDFNATVAGLFNPSQGVNWTTDIGAVNSAGLLSGLTGIIGTVQTGTVTATSQLDGSYAGTATFTIAALPAELSRAPRFARPESDVSAGGWTPSTGSSLFAMIDELSADSGDFISATSAATAVVALNPVVDPNTSNNQVVRYQAWAPSGGGLTVRLKQGSTVIASWTHATLPVSPTIFPQTLTAPQCDSITDYTLLRLEFVASP